MEISLWRDGGNWSMLGMVHQEHAADFLFRSVEVSTNASVKCKELADGRGKNGYFIFGIG